MLQFVTEKISVWERLKAESRPIYLYGMGDGAGHIQSLIVMAVLFMVGIITYLLGLLADVIASNRKILEDVQYHVRRAEYDIYEMKTKQEKEEGVKDAE